MNALVLTIAIALGAQTGAPPQNPWVDGPDAPAPDPLKPQSVAPREEGAVSEPLTNPARAPDPKKPALKSAIPALPAPLRLETVRTRAELAGTTSLDLEGALFDVPGLWMQRDQMNASRLSARGLDDTHLGVVIDDAPLLTMGGLLAPIEVLSLDGSARLTMENGPRVLSRARHSSAGVLSMSTEPTPKDHGEALDLDGVLAGGVGGANLEKGVLAAVESGWHRARVSLHGSLINREDQRQGRSFVPFGFGEAVDAPKAGLLVRSSGNGGAAGIRVDVQAQPRVRVFQSWHSARAVDVPRPTRCTSSDDLGRAEDCVRTLERGADLWIAGADAGLDVFGIDVVARPRFSIQHAVAKDERSGVRVLSVDKALDEGVGGSASLLTEAIFPRVALLDVWQPRVQLLLDGTRERVFSGTFSRSLRPRDAEPPGDGIADPLRARLIDGATTSSTSAGVGLFAHGARVSLAAEGRVRHVSLAAPAVPTRMETPLDTAAIAPQASLSARARVLDGLSVFGALVHTDAPADLSMLRGPELGDTVVLPPTANDARFVDNTLELGAHGEGSFFDLESVLWASSRSGRLFTQAIQGDAFGRRQTYRRPDEQALGLEGRGRMRFGPDGLAALGTLSAMLIDEGALLDVNERVAAPGVLNPLATFELSYAPPQWPFGMFVRARGILPHTRLSPNEELDRALCPELPRDDELAAGFDRTQPCSGAEGALLLDVGAHLQAGRVRFDVVGQNLLDREGRVRGEAIGSGGLGIAALVSIGL